MKSDMGAILDLLFAQSEQEIRKASRDYIDDIVLRAKDENLFGSYYNEVMTLIEVGWCEPSETRASLFLSTGRATATLVGKAVFESGGIAKMRVVHGIVEEYFPRYAAKELEAAWSGIGPWRA